MYGDINLFLLYCPPAGFFVCLFFMSCCPSHSWWLPLPAPTHFFQVVCLALFCLISEKICVFWVNCTTYLNKFSFLAFVHWKIKFCEVVLQEEGIEAEKNEAKTRRCMMVHQEDCRFSEGQVAQNLSRRFSSFPGHQPGLLVSHATSE